MNEERIHVSDPKIPRRHARPAPAAIRADAESRRGLGTAVRCRRGAVNLARIGLRNQDAVGVRIDVIDRRPRLAAVRTSQESADFDSDMNDVWIFWMEGDTLRVRLMRWASGLMLSIVVHVLSASA